MIENIFLLFLVHKYKEKQQEKNVTEEFDYHSKGGKSNIV